MSFHLKIILQIIQAIRAMLDQSSAWKNDCVESFKEGIFQANDFSARQLTIPQEK